MRVLRFCCQGRARGGSGTQRRVARCASSSAARGLDPASDTSAVRPAGARRGGRLRRALAARRPAARCRDVEAAVQVGPGRGGRVRAAAAVLRRPGRSRRSGSTSPSKVFVARGGVAELTTTILTRRRGARPRRADAQDVGPPGRPVARPFVDADAARRVAAARRDPRHHPRPLARQHPQVRRQGRPPRRPGRARAP